MVLADVRSTLTRDDAQFAVWVIGLSGSAAAASAERALREHGLDAVLDDARLLAGLLNHAPRWHTSLRLFTYVTVRHACLASGERDRTLVRLNFDELPSDYAHLLMLPQDVTERVLRDALAATHREVRWGWRVDSLAETGDGVEATVATPEGSRVIRARYAVGADGMHSLVREVAGIGFTGGSYEDSFVLADVDMQWVHGRDEVMLYFSPAGMLVVAPLPGGRFRLVATLEDAPEHPGVGDMQALLDARGPTRGAARVERVHWSSRFRLHHRVADRYRNGRLFLVGDAAHAHSPAGGQGMNTGIVDACVLGNVLANVLLGRRGISHLDEYERLRRPAAEQVLKLAGRLTAMATVRGRLRRAARNVLLRMAGRLPPVRRRLQMQLSGLARRPAARLSTP